MAFPGWVHNLIAYSLQIGILAAAGTLLAYLFRLRAPRVTLMYWQFLLLACLFIFALQEWQHPISYPAAASAEVPSPPLAVKAAPATPRASFHFEPVWIGWILAAGIWVRLGWLALGFLRLRFFRRNARTVQPESSVIEEVQSRTGITAEVLFSGEIDTPVTFGFRKPAVILPLKFNDLNEGCRTAVLCHELLHIRRRDWLFIIGEEMIRSVFWFHPAIWWLLGRIRLSREQAVDYEVVRLTGNRQPYLESLLEFARAQGRPKAVPAPLFLKERHLLQRVVLLVKEVSMSRSRLCISLAAVSVLLIGTVRLAAAWFPLMGAPVLVQERIPMAMPGNVSPTTSHQIPVPGKPVPAKALQIHRAAAKTSKIEVAANALPNLEMSQPEPLQDPAPAFGSEPIKVGGNVQESKLVYKVEPVYPEEAKRARVSGRVILVVTADKEGLVSDVRITAGHPLLAPAAVDAVKQWRYSPTLLNGMPVPVMFTVTCVFNFMGDDDVIISVDESGSVKVTLPPVELDEVTPKMARGGTAHINIAPNTPIQVAEKALQSLQQRGVGKIEVRAPFTLYQGKLFYTGAPATPPQLIPNIQKLRGLLDASSVQATPGTVNMLYYSIYVNEFGEILGVQRIAGPDNPEIDRELMRSQVISPGMLSVNPVPFVYSFRMGI